MVERQTVLVDTSVWIRFFRTAGAVEAKHLDILLQSRAVLSCAPVRAELVSGARTEHERRQLQDLLGALPILDPPVDIWEIIETARFSLARRGRQVSLIDLFIAGTALFHAVPIWTLDTDFSTIQSQLPILLYSP